MVKREILFRGKRYDNKEWVEGGYIPFDVDSGYTYMVEPYNYASTLSALDLIKLNSILVIPDTVGQYTGLTDKNGTKIFEGDIVECWSEGVKARGTVTHRIDGLWIIYPAWQKRIMWGLCPDNDGNTTVEVIGNIHDNPEILQNTNP